MLKMYNEWPQFFTATNLNWKSLLKPDKYKDIVMDSLQFLVLDGRVNLYAYVIMINHIHLIWQILDEHQPDNVQRDFLKFTAQKMKADMRRHDQNFLEEFRVDAKDRKYQFWERDALSVELFTEKVFKQKFNYLHQNPVKAGLSNRAEDYKYSSAKFYCTGIDGWGYLRNYKAYI